MSDMIYCRECGTQIHVSAISCPKCGAVQKTSSNPNEKKILPAFLLCALIGGLFGFHRFYVGKIGTGILMIVLSWTTISLWWAIIDLIMIVTGNFKDKAGNKLTQWT